MNRREFLKIVGASVASLTVVKYSFAENKTAVGRSRPNILFCIADDQSWIHAGAYGAKVVKTPNFDRVAREGILFMHSFCAAPSCTPSRSAILTGQQIWRVEKGGILFGALPNKFQVYPDLLEDAGYHVGYVHKGWSPGSPGAGGWDHNPAGRKRYNARKIPKSAKWGGKRDYAGNFEDFLNDCGEGQPWCFWYGCEEPHRGYEKGSGLKSGKKLEDVKVPPSLPDVAEVRSDILDYYVEIEWYDEHLGRMIRKLEEIGELDNTIIVVTSDNGMPFPRAKTNLYDLGTRMPLAVRWGEKVKGGRVVEDFMSHVDFAPTFLEAAGVKVPAEMTGRSFMNILLSDRSGRVDQSRDKVVTAMERHTICRAQKTGYPCRAMRTYDWLYIRNYTPDRWPCGDPDFDSKYANFYGDIDNSPTKTYMMQHKDDPKVTKLFELGFGKRPTEELYDVKKDPWQVRNLADDPAYAETKKKLLNELEKYQRQTKDPRIEGNSPWDI
ncbi:MAG: sulfatase family protein [Planctomycetota bacterium]|jgi:uncharacterized sulfatase